MMMWQVTKCFLQVLYLENLIADIQNILGLNQQWTNEIKIPKDRFHNHITQCHDMFVFVQITLKTLSATLHCYHYLIHCVSLCDVRLLSWPSLPDMVGVGCEHDGVIYRNGQSFKPSCKYQCLCVNGAIGCVSLCTDSQPPRVWCQNPRRVKIPGRCCEQWICDEPKKGRKTAPRHAVEGRTQIHQSINQLRLRSCFIMPFVSIRIQNTYMSFVRALNNHSFNQSINGGWCHFKCEDMLILIAWMEWMEQYDTIPVITISCPPVTSLHCSMLQLICMYWES